MHIDVIDLVFLHNDYAAPRERVSVDILGCRDVCVCVCVVFSSF